MSPERFAPGCFGSALTFRAGAPECRSCPFAGACQPKHVAALAAMRDRIMSEPGNEIAKRRIVYDRAREAKPRVSNLDLNLSDIFGALERAP